MKSRETLWKLQNGVCFWCGEGMNSLNSDPDHIKAPTIDHLTPKVVKSSKHPKEKVLACKGCNVLRGTYNTQHWNQTKADVKSLREENKRLNDLLLKYLEQPWWRKVYIHFFRFVEFIRDKKFV